MPAIIDPQAIRFVNEQVRPLCEQVRALMVKIDTMNTSWSAGISALFPNDTSALTDGHIAEGVSQLTGAQVVQAVSNMIALKTASNSQIIDKPCVRAISVT